MERVFLLWVDCWACDECGDVTREIQSAHLARPEFGPPIPRDGYYSGLWAYQDENEELIGMQTWGEPHRRWIQEVAVTEEPV